MRVPIRFRVLRDGVVTSGAKRVRVIRGWGSGSRLEMGELAEDGEFTPWLSILAQELADQSEWAVIAIDDTPPRKAFTQYMAIPGEGTYTINISTGSGGGPTEPATLDARVRVDGLPASREVVVVERPPSGDWRVAGHGVADGAGVLALDLDVTEGSLYALGLDDFGLPFSPGLAVEVGRRIRPTVFTGVLYEITEAGVLPATEPTWWPITSE